MYKSDVLSWTAIIVSVFLFIGFIVNTLQINELADRINSTLESLIKTNELVIETAEQVNTLQQNAIVTNVLFQAIGEDYPPKMKMAEREWCENRKCLEGTFAH